MSLFVIKGLDLHLLKQETLAQVFSCEICEIFKNTFLLQNASDCSFCISEIPAIYNTLIFECATKKEFQGFGFS